VTPPASAPTGVAEITVGNSSTTGAASARAQVLGNQIKWTQDGTTSTISTSDGSPPPIQNAVVGQQISLTTPALPRNLLKNVVRREMVKNRSRQNDRESTGRRSVMVSVSRLLPHFGTSRPFSTSS
jgi:hypothetical protein